MRAIRHHPECGPRHFAGDIAAAEQTNDKYPKRVLSEVVKDVSAGHGLAESFQNKGENLPRVFIERWCAPARKAVICPKA